MRAFTLAFLAAAACSPLDADRPATPAGPAGVAVPPAPSPLPDPVLPAALQGQEGDLAVDPARSRIVATGAKITGQHEVVFPLLEGTLRLGEGRVQGLRVVADVDRLSTTPDRLVQHLRSPDFFDTASHPRATFDSVEVRPSSGGGWEVLGNLTVRGTTRGVVAPATVEVIDGVVEARTRFELDRQEYGVSFPGMPDDLIRDQVPVEVTLVVPLPENGAPTE